MDIFLRTRMLIGSERVEMLGFKRVMVIGLGGVGSFAVEALARAGIQKFVLVDPDRIEPSNFNRQLLALNSTLNKPKVEVMFERIKDINPQAEIVKVCDFYSPDNAHKFFSWGIDYIIDAIDSVGSKIHLIEQAIKRQIPIVSSMGTGNRLDPSKLKLADISETRVCPLARVVRKELRKRGITTGVDVVFSDEIPLIPPEEYNERVPGSISFVPPVAGFLLASRVVKRLINIDK